MRARSGSSSLLRTTRPLVRSLLLGGLLSANCVWAGTWNITFTPMQTADTPPMPVYSWTPPSSSVLFGGVVTCTGGDITFDTSNGVFPLPGADPSQAFVQFDNLFESPSSIGVTVTPTGGSDATCALNARPMIYNYAAETLPTTDFSTSIREGYVRLINATYDPVTGYNLVNTLPAEGPGGSSSWDYFQADPNLVDANTISTGAHQVSISASGTASTNVFVHAKTTAATVEFELTSPQLTDSTITFTVEAAPQSYGTAYDPIGGGYEAAYGTPIQVTVVIPAGSTTVSVTLPGILPGSEVTITPVSHPGSVVGEPVLVKTSPLPLASISQNPIDTTNVVATPGSTGPFTETVPTNVIDFKVTLDVPTVPPTTPQAIPTLGEWGLGLLGALIAGFAALRRRSLAGRS